MSEFLILPEMDNFTEVEGEPTIVVADGAGDYSVEGKDASRGERLVIQLRTYEKDFDFVPYEKRIHFLLSGASMLAFSSRYGNTDNPEDAKILEKYRAMIDG